jgi:hypothetical protein
MTQELSYETSIAIGLQAPEEQAQETIWYQPFASYQKTANQEPSSGNQSGSSIENDMGIVSENPPKS